ncbi:MAG TPA: hypothetical protein VLG38_01805 [Gammaproteobacteria bacterium]|nr:hypothetical protein [Gammaproteobacteria bacterium]
MSFICKSKLFFRKIFKLDAPAVTLEPKDLGKRMDRLERNYIILLKRILEIDGVQLMTKSSAFTNKVLATPSDEFNKGLNEPEPTIH